MAILLINLKLRYWEDAVGKKTISSKSLKADLSEYFTGTPLTEEKTDAIA